MSPWPPEGEPHGKGHEGRDAAAARSRRPSPACSSTASTTCATRSSGPRRATPRCTSPPASVAKALLARDRDRGRGIDRRRGGAARPDRRRAGRARHRRRDRRGPRPRRPARARQLRVEGRPARCAAGGRGDGHPGGQGRRDRRRLRARGQVRLGGPRRDRHSTGAAPTNHAGGIEAGVSNGEEIVVRAAMKPLPTLMKPLGSVDLATGEAAQALVERSDVAAVEALAVVAEAAVAWELALRRAREVRRRHGRRLRRRLAGLPRADRLALAWTILDA